MYPPRAVFTILALVIPSVLGQSSPQNIAAAYSLTVSTTLPFPTSTLAAPDSGDFVVTNWNLNKNKIQNQPDDLAFVADPFPTSSLPPATPSANNTGPVLQVTYPSGSFGDSNGGAQFYSFFNDSTSPQTMLLSYEVAFDSGFQFVKGGKLPGLRGGPITNGCEGGSEPNGTDCWSTRMMWRSAGAGEVYAYILDSNKLCDQSNIICDSDFGTSISRGSFSFAAGEWNRISMLVQLNNPGDVANGNVLLYYNDIQAIQQGNLQMRSSTNVFAGGLFFSTFFGGDDSTWASPTTQHSFFRNFQLWLSDRPSNSTGSQVSSAASLHGAYGAGARWLGLWPIGAGCVTAVTLAYGVL
ncbi:polysaccharide lyase family 14 protein [Ramaria rubella]|nr:polysaccharide lyase family 14 protein [Ramaria rubella]